MPSTFSWLDHSDRERDRMLDAIQGFVEQDTRDELGLGAIRDAFSDLFFPGTNTIQTRARYFLFVPWIYRSIECSGRSGDNAAARARKAEVLLCNALASSGDAEGVIGRRARETLKRLPSNIYWLGLKEWGIRRFPHSQDEYHARLGKPEVGKLLTDDDGALVDGGVLSYWDPNLPPEPERLLQQATLDLSREEALYLRDRITFSHQDSLLAHLVRSECELDGSFPWEHAEVQAFPPAIREGLEHARWFSETMFGAVLLYNLMLAERLSGDRKEATLATVLEQVASWSNRVADRVGDFASWDRSEFWSLVTPCANVRQSTRAFVEKWLTLGLLGDADGLARSDAARALIMQRELALKQSRARLKNQRALELWGGVSGGAQLNYRWRVAGRMVRDIHAGLRSGGNRARAA